MMAADLDYTPESLALIIHSRIKNVTSPDKFRKRKRVCDDDDDDDSQQVKHLAAHQDPMTVASNVIEPVSSLNRELSRYVIVDGEKISLKPDGEVAEYIRQKMVDPLDPRVDKALEFIANSDVIRGWNLKDCYKKLRALTVASTIDTSPGEHSSETITELSRERALIDGKTGRPSHLSVRDIVWWLKFAEEAEQQLHGSRMKFYRTYAQHYQKLSNSMEPIEKQSRYLQKMCLKVSSHFTKLIEVFGFGIIAYIPDEFDITKLMSGSYTTAVAHGLAKILLMRKNVNMFKDLCVCMQSLIRDMLELGRKAPVSQNIRVAKYLLQKRQPSISKHINIPGPDVHLTEFAPGLATTDLDSLASNQKATTSVMKLMTDIISLETPQGNGVEVYPPGKASMCGKRLVLSGETISKADQTVIPILIKSPDASDCWFAVHADWKTGNFRLFDPSHDYRVISSTGPAVSLWDEISDHLEQFRPQRNTMHSPKPTLAKIRSGRATCEDSSILVLQYVQEILSGKTSYVGVARLREQYFRMALNHVWPRLISPEVGSGKSVASDGSMV